MATLIGDYASDHSCFHPSVTTYQHQHQTSPRATQQQSESSPYRSASRPADAPSHQTASSAAASLHSSSLPRAQGAEKEPLPAVATSVASSSSGLRAAEDHKEGTQSLAAAVADTQTAATGGASRFPSPPDSSSPSGSAASTSHSAENVVQSQHGNGAAYMASPAHGSTPRSSTQPAITSTSHLVPSASVAPPLPHNAIPSPASEPGAAWTPSHHDPTSSPPQTQTTIRVRDLAHIQSLARADLMTGNGPGILNDPPLQAMKYEISSMPIGDIIEMVAALLTKITTTNDLQHDALNRNANHVKQAQAQNEGSAIESHMSPLSSSVLAFHGKNVPAITILSYLSRIHKYCPTTYEVFLSLLVYFDRMTERVNDLVMKADEARRSSHSEQPAAPRPAPSTDVEMRDDDSSDSDESDEDLADDSDDDEPRGESASRRPSAEKSGDSAAGRGGSSVPSPMTFFVVDSFNIHRLIISGVTCASKFFSDVFYTNSRYAKVGGLPLAELNHLELQFLLLNDFRLAVPVEDLEAYATMLVEFYAREVVAQRSRPVTGMD